MIDLRPSPRAWRQRFKAVVYPLVEGTWRRMFAVAGVAFQPTLRLAQFSGRETVLAIVPHPDDEALGCARALALHVSAGDRVRILAVTNGELSRAHGLSPSEMATRRALEFEAATKELGVEGKRLDLPEGGWSEDDLERHLATELAGRRPTVVYAPSTVDYHPEHRAVARCLGRVLATIGAAIAAGAAIEVRVYQVHVPLTPVLANLGVATSDTEVAARVKSARAHYATQLFSITRADRLMAYGRALWRVDGDLEVFWSLPAADYGRLMSLDPGSFRGIRDRPFTDPLSWLVGLSHRRRLARAARSIQRKTTT